MRPVCRQLIGAGCPRSVSLGWRGHSRSLSEAATARRQRQQLKADRTNKLLEQFKQRARNTLTQPPSSSSSPPSPHPLPSLPHSRTAAVRVSATDGEVSIARSRSSFFRPPTVASRPATVTQRQPTAAPTRQQSRAEQREHDEDEDEDDAEDEEGESDIGLTSDGVSSATLHQRKQAEQLRALIERRKLAHDARRNHPDVQAALAPPLAALYTAATTAAASTASSSSLSSSSPPHRPKPQQRVLALSILGLPNSGKSSLTNRICHNHITAVSPKSHTTRSNVTGVRTDVGKQVQLVIHDTPGILGRHEGKKHERDMSVAAWMAAGDVSVVLVCIDAAKRWTDTTTHMFNELTRLCRTQYSLTPILVLNKVDLVHPKRDLLSTAQQCVEACRYIKDVYYISIADDDGVDDLIDALYAKAKPGQWEYEPHVVSDMSPLERIEEVIREKLYMRYNQELPYTIEQRHVAWNEQDDRVWVEQQLRVDSEAQKSIVIGGRGSGVEWVKREAEREASEMLGKRVNLHLSVQVGKKKDGVTDYS